MALRHSVPADLPDVSPFSVVFPCFRFRSVEIPGIPQLGFVCENKAIDFVIRPARTVPEQRLQLRFRPRIAQRQVIA